MEYNDKQIGRNIKAIRNANKKNYLEFAEAILKCEVEDGQHKVGACCG